MYGDAALNLTPRIYALIVAAGTGSRAGGVVPKQYQAIAGKPLLSYSCEALAAHPSIAGVQVVMHAEHADFYREAMAGLDLLPPVTGGAERSDSVRLGLEALAAYDPDYVLVHDAARPFLSHGLITQLIEKLSPEHAVLPAIPVVDTVRRYEAGAWEEVSRAGLLRVMTPQAFPFARLQQLLRAGAQATDEAAIWLAAGGKLVYVEADEDLRKVTTHDDIAWAEQHATTRRRTAVGMGFDVHELFPAGEKQLMRIGGIDIAHDHKLHGHSDADVVLHAMVDALLGAIADGDIGAHFSPKDDRWKGADSRMFVEETVRRVKARGGIIQHVDVTVICESPKIGPHREAMREAIAAMLGVKLQYVSVKATTTERLGFTGRGEGVAAQAVATVSLPEGA